MSIRKKGRNRTKKATPKDTISKLVFSDDFRFAEVFNKALFKTDYVKPEELIESNPTEYSFSEDKALQQHRDTLKKLYKGEELAILGMEHQSSVDYIMPLRVMYYDCINYYKQRDTINQNRIKKLKGAEFLSRFAKKDKLKPVLTLVIYYGDEKWDGPRSLKDMLDIKSPVIEAFVPDFPIHIVDVKHLKPEEIESYTGYVKILFGILSYAKDDDKLDEFYEKNREMFSDIPFDIAKAIQVFGDRNIELGEVSETGGIDMSNIFDNLRENAREKGRIEGRTEGRIEGRTEGRIEGRTEGRIEGRNEEKEEIALNLIKLNFATLEQIVAATGLTPARVKELQATL